MKFKKNKTQFGRSRSKVNSTLNQQVNFSKRNVESKNADKQSAKSNLKHGLLVFGQKFGIFLLVVAGLVSLINVLTLSSVPRIVYLKTDGQTGQLRETKIYEDYAAKVLSSSSMNGNKLTFNETKVSNDIAAHFPEIKNVSVTIPFLSHKPIVYLEPAVATLILANDQAAYVVADNGKAILHAPDTSGLSKFKLPVIKDSYTKVNSANDRLLPTSTIAFIKEINVQLTAKSIQITDMTLPANNSELNVRVEGKPYMIKFNLQDDTAREQAGTAIAVMNYLNRKNIQPSQYIDARVAGRAYYK